MSKSKLQSLLRRFLRFRLVTLLWFVVCLAIILGWWKDHEDLRRQLAEADVIRHIVARAAQPNPADPTLSEPRGLYELAVNYRSHQIMRRMAYSASFMRGKTGEQLASIVDEPAEGGQWSSSDRKKAILELKVRGAWRGPRAIQALSDVDADIQWISLDAVCARYVEPALAIPALQTEMAKEPSVLAVRAARELHKMDAALGAVDRLIEIVASSDDEVRLWAAMALADIGSPDAGSAVPTLLEQAGDPDPSVQRMILLALGELADPATARRLLLRAYQEAEDDETRTAAASALGRLEIRASAAK